MAKTIGKVYSFLRRLIYVNALPCETLMLQIVSLRGDYVFVSDCSPLHHQFDRRCYAI